MDFKTNQELFDKAYENGLYDKLLIQIQKDFNRANIELELSRQITTHEITQLIQEKLYVLLLEKFDDYLNVLYVIDIPEKSLRRIKSSDVVEVSKEVTFLILNREFQKVCYKNQFE
ncbi:hypothetical protein [Croceitalea rosinachiae]|uniref:Uncharacterized protein n=1 Tax=Croceitalea rosinachiae TaxID=3075596 RepID=A0ABU3A6D6_9FLAO|nr:hypothetical protein [Croceitalea sp. F388]MDT0605740.1 hypothetical protein [Croceitalea sp. F388]